MMPSLRCRVSTSATLYHSLQAIYSPANPLYPSLSTGGYFEYGHFWFEEGDYWQSNESDLDKPTKLPMLTDATSRNIEFGIPVQILFQGKRWFVNFTFFGNLYSRTRTDYKTAIGIDTSYNASYQSHPTISSVATSPRAQFTAGIRLQ